MPNPGNQPLGTQWPTQPEATGGSAQIITHCPTAAQVAAAIPTPAPKGTTYLPTCPFAVETPGSTAVWGGSMNGGTDMMPMSLSPQTGDLYLRILRGLEGLDYEEFEDTVHSIAQTADKWDD